MDPTQLMDPTQPVARILKIPLTARKIITLQTTQMLPMQPTRPEMDQEMDPEEEEAATEVEAEMETEMEPEEEEEVATEVATEIPLSLIKTGSSPSKDGTGVAKEK